MRIRSAFTVQDGIAQRLNDRGVAPALDARLFGVNVIHMKIEKRSYRMTKRAAAAAKTGRAILQSAFELWRQKGLDEITLQEVADGAGVTVQTVLRHFGSKEGIVAAAIESDIGGVQAGRNQAPPGDIEKALDVLFEHYEADGAAVLRNLAIEERVEAARVVAQGGRTAHRQWCARVFGPFLPPEDDPARQARLDGFVAATDLYVWKLFRQDLGRTEEETRAAVGGMLRALAERAEDAHMTNPNER
jgi:AcrR family transcriptional regulator